MTVDLSAAAAFLATHGRLLDRRRFEYLLGDTDAAAVLAAVDGYRNPDGGYGWGLEPDLRAPESQPGGALHALEVFAEVGPTPRAVEVCAWLGRISLPDGGVPFALPVADPAGCAPFWADADPRASSLQSTAFVAGVAHQVAAGDPGVAAHPWLAAATRYCFAAIAELDGAPHAIALRFAVGFLDATYDTHAEAPPLFDKLATFIPPDGLVPVAGGADGETMRPLDFAPLPDRPARRLFSAEVIAEDLRRVEAGQQDDGGWRVDFDSYSPAAALEWRGYLTVGTVSLLRANSR
ncbi:hypothetical protein [Actinophytocola sediminis]